jgi:uncharacterized membrane protein
MKRKHFIIHGSILLVLLGGLAALSLMSVVEYFEPIWLLALLLLPGFIWVASRGRSGLPAPINTASSTVRSILFIILILCLADIQVVLRSNSLCVMFLLDHSASIPNNILDEELNYVNAAVETKDGKDTAGIIVFGENASVEHTPEKMLNVERIDSFVNRDYTDLASAVSLASATFPENARRKLVLITDGNENQGDLVQAVRDAAGSGIVTDILPVNYDYPSEVLVDKVYLPDKIKEKETFDLKVQVHSLRPGPATLTIFRNGEPLTSDEVMLDRGDNTFNVSMKIEEPGFYTFSARISTDPEKLKDTITQNNQASSYVYIQGASRVLLVAPSDIEARYLAQACLRDNLEADIIGPESLPDSLGQLQNYDCIVLANVSADQLSAEQMSMLQANVRDLGVGLVMVGGENSFGAGSYEQTPIEEALPVSMDIKQKKINPKGALAIILHTCEFPQGNFWAKEISKKAIETVNSQDDVGILLYDWDGGDRWLFELRAADNKAFMFNKIDNAMPGDMPSFIPTMKLAHEGLLKSDAMVKHMIIISDGDPASPSPTKIKEMADDGITISTIAINPHSPRDVDIMRYIAHTTGGKYYRTDDPSKLPQIFIKEAKVVKRSLIFNQQFQPMLVLSTELTKGIQPSEIPPLLAYVATTPKPRATVVMTSDNENEDPILAYWRYGLGKSVAFTSDATSNWAKDWVAWDKYEKLWTQTIRWASRKREQNNLHIRTRMDGHQGKLIIDAIDEKGAYINFLKMNARMVDVNNNGHSLDIRQTAPGKYEASFSARETGVNILNIGYQNPQTGGQGFIATGIAVPYSPEFRELEYDVDLLARAARAGGGKLLKGDISQDNVFSSDMPPTMSYRSVMEYLLMLGLLVFFIDVVLRRVIITREDLSSTLANIKLALLKRRIEGERDETMDALLKRKEKSKERKKGGAEVSRDFQASLQKRSAEKDSATPDVRAQLADQVSEKDAPKAAPAEKKKAARTKADETDSGSDYTSRLLAAKKRALKKDDEEESS